MSKAHNRPKHPFKYIYIYSRTNINKVVSEPKNISGEVNQIIGYFQIHYIFPYLHRYFYCKYIDRLRLEIFLIGLTYTFNILVLNSRLINKLFH